MKPVSPTKSVTIPAIRPMWSAAKPPVKPFWAWYMTVIRPSSEPVMVAIESAVPRLRPATR